MLVRSLATCLCCWPCRRTRRPRRRNLTPCWRGKAASHTDQPEAPSNRDPGGAPDADRLSKADTAVADHSLRRLRV